MFLPLFDGRGALQAVSEVNLGMLVGVRPPYSSRAFAHHWLGEKKMFRGFAKLMLVVGIGMTGAACVDDGNPAPRNYYPAAPATYYQPPPPGYNNPYYRNDGSGYTTVTVTNRGQNGNRDDVVQQRVACGSQYYDGYRQRTARC